MEMKEKFLEYLRSTTNDNSNKPSSYAKAMEIIEDVLFSQTFRQSTSIWNFINANNVDIIYNLILNQQNLAKKNEKSVFSNYTPESYWKQGFCSAALSEYKAFLKIYGADLSRSNQTTNKLSFSSLPKPFLLLAGISGTGKTRFVKEQAKASAEKFGLSEGENLCLVPVRPDWHEPSDLLGYVSRIGGTRFITTPFLKFMLKAWYYAIDKIDNNEIVYKELDNIPPFWLCLDEMNLAPVEQYFADYLSILETRKWENSKYSCDPILKKDVLNSLNHKEYRKDGDGQQELAHNARDQFWVDCFTGIKNYDSVKGEQIKEYFNNNGIPLPPNLIVAGTVNMDETTHGFSRKVIDRAITLDFGQFFPNDYDSFFTPQNQPVTLNYPTETEGWNKEILSGIVADSDGQKSLEFLKKINEILKNTAFELAYRALNELLLAVACFKPADDVELCSVWDDFLMQKILPRIEGDNAKLRHNPVDKRNEQIQPVEGLDEKEFGKGTVLHELYRLLSINELFKAIWSGEESRYDLLRVKKDNPEDKIKIACRSRKKIEWMLKRLKSGHFTDFWV